MKKNYFSNNYSKQQKNNTYRLNTEPSYIPHKTEVSYQNNHLSSQGTTGETKYIQTEKNLSPKLIHKERPKQKGKKSNENKLYDLQHTLTINVKIIQDFLKPETLPQLNNQKIKKLQNKIIHRKISIYSFKFRKALAFSSYINLYFIKFFMAFPYCYIFFFRKAYIFFIGIFIHF